MMGAVSGEESGQGFTGPKMFQLANAIGNGTANYVLGSNIYQGQVVGVGVGAGVGTGTIAGVIGPLVGASIFSEMNLNNLRGAKALQLSNAIGNAFANTCFT